MPRSQQLLAFKLQVLGERWFNLLTLEIEQGLLAVNEPVSKFITAAFHEAVGNSRILRDSSSGEDR